MTPFRVSVVAALVSLVLLVVVLELIRSRRLRERYALLWLLTASVLLVLSLWRGGLDTIADFVGIHYAPSVLFAVAGLFGVVVLLHFSTVLSRLADQNAILAQHVALLEAERSGAAERLPLEALHAEAGEAGVRSAPVEELRPVARDDQRRRGSFAAVDPQG